MKTNCYQCGQEIERKPCLFKRYKRFFCSRKCYSLANIGKELSEATKNKISISGRKREKRGKFIKCDYCKKITYKYPSHFKKGLKHYFCCHKCHGLFYRGVRLNPNNEFKKGNVPPFKGKKGVHPSPATEFKKGHKAVSGKDHPFWKGGKSRNKHSGMRCVKWREKIFERDKYTCHWCGQRGGKLNAHHFKFWANYPKLRYKISNGITLCVGCHKIIHIRKMLVQINI